MKKHLYLSGFMGAGKSRIGRELAALTDHPFYDSDKWIEEREGLTVREIFEQKGEAYFREAEKEALRHLAGRKEASIVALGGGAILDEKNRRLLKKTGTLVYIKTSPEAIFERVRHSKKRPLLTVAEGPGYEQALLQRIRQLLAEREPLYKEADVIIERDGLSLSEIVEAVLKFANLKPHSSTVRNQTGSDQKM